MTCRPLSSFAKPTVSQIAARLAAGLSDRAALGVAPFLGGTTGFLPFAFTDDRTLDDDTVGLVIPGGTSGWNTNFQFRSNGYLYTPYRAPRTLPAGFTHKKGMSAYGDTASVAPHIGGPGGYPMPNFINASNAAQYYYWLPYYGYGFRYELPHLDVGIYATTQIETAFGLSEFSVGIISQTYAPGGTVTAATYGASIPVAGTLAWSGLDTSKNTYDVLRSDFGWPDAFATRLTTDITQDFTPVPGVFASSADQEGYDITEMTVVYADNRWQPYPYNYIWHHATPYNTPAYNIKVGDVRYMTNAPVDIEAGYFGAAGGGPRYRLPPWPYIHDLPLVDGLTGEDLGILPGGYHPSYVNLAPAT